MSTPTSAATCRLSQAARHSSARRTLLLRNIHTTRLLAEEEPPFQKPVAETPPSQPPTSPHRKTTTYPLYPSVAHLLRTNNIPLHAASSIPATGPAGRLLKGDVLAHLGRIQKTYSKDQSARIAKMGHLDLTNYQKAAPKPDKAKEAVVPPSAQKQEPLPEPDTEVALPISLSAVLATQHRIQQSLGLTLPLSTFIARASEIANRDLPASGGKGAALSADELFDAVLGLDKVPSKTKSVTGGYTPHITNLGSGAAAKGPKVLAKKQLDIMDLLTGSEKPHSAKMGPSSSAGGQPVPGVKNIFSVAAKKGEEKRARTYLERVKTVLEAEPGRCVL